MIAGILLVAGRSIRFGRDKLLVQMPDGAPMMVASARPLLDVADRVFAVVRPGADAAADLLARHGAVIVPCAQADAGMSASLSCGVHAVAEFDACVIALGDMPFIRSKTARTVVDALRAGAPAVVPTFEGRFGHPVGFGRSLYRELMQLEGDEGARSILRRHDIGVEVIECDDPGIVRDIDHPHQLPGVTE